MESEKITNEELRLKIAALKGWTDVCSEQYGTIGEQPLYWLRGNRHGSKVRMTVPNWPEEIAHAWALVEEWRASGSRRWAILDTPPPDGSTYCCILRDDEPGHLAITERADTAPRAVAIAYLTSTERGKENTNE